MFMMAPLVSIIYVNYNTSDLIGNSIMSLREHCKDVPFEIIIVDNSSTDAEKEKLGRLFVGEEDVKVVFSPVNLGFSRANNQGERISSGKYLFFLNPDTLILNDVLKIFY